MIRERVIRFHYDDTALSFITEPAIPSFQKAVGRMLTYGLRSGVNDGIEFVEVFLNPEGALTAAFYPATSFYEAQYDADSREPFFMLDNALTYFKQTEPLTMAAFPDTQGAYNFH